MNDLSTGLLSLLWRASWQGALVTGIVWGVCRAFERWLPASLRCTLYRLTYLKLLLGLAIAGGVALPLLRPVPVLPEAVQATPAPAAAPTETATETETADAPPIPTAFPALPPVNRAEPQAANGSPRPTWQTAAAATYLAGLLVCLTRLLSAWIRTRRVLRAATSSDESEVHSLCEELSARLGLRHAPTVARSTELVSPAFVAGRILLPASADYAPDELRLILAHELAHARRRDLACEWLGVGAQVLFFFHPLVYLARREERLARESAADTLALGVTNAPAAAFGKLLLALALEPRPLPALAGAVGAVERGVLLRRRLVALKEISAMPVRRKLALLALGAALTLIPWRITHARNGQPWAHRIPPNTDIFKHNAAFPAIPHGDHQIVGMVRDDQKNPVGNAAVQAVWWQNFPNSPAIKPVSPMMAIHADASGRYTLNHLPAGHFTLLVMETVHSIKELRQMRGVSLAGRFALTTTEATIGSGEATKVLDLTASRGVTLSGRVLNGATGLPIPGIHVLGSRETRKGDWTKVSNDASVTDAEGHYFLRLLPGQVFAQLMGTGTRWDNTIDKIFSLSLGQSATYDFRITPATRQKSIVNVPVHSPQAHGDEKLAMASHAEQEAFLKAFQEASHGDKSIVGQVRDEDGKPVANLEIRISVWYTVAGQKRSYLIMPKTDDQGRYALPHIAAGDYRITLGTFMANTDKFMTDQKKRTAIRPLRPYAAEPIFVTLSSTDKAKTADFRATRGVVLTGRILNSADGTPVAYANIFAGAAKHPGAEDIHAISDELSDFAETDSEGYYHLRLSPGRVHLELQRLDGVEQNEVFELPAGANAVHDFSATVPPALTFVGLDGKPVVGASASVSGLQGQQGSPYYGIVGKTDRNGRLWAEGIRAGTFRADTRELSVTGRFDFENGTLVTKSHGAPNAPFVTGGATVHMFPRQVAAMR